MSTPSDQLFDAAWNGRLRDIESILDSGEVIPPTAIGSALQAAVYNAQPDACDLLLARGADSNTSHEPTDETVLHQAHSRGQTLNLGADPADHCFA